MGYGLLGSVFNFLDPILDDVDPMHNPVQTWTTGSSETKGQRPYFEAIAPLIVDAFLPGVGSAIGAADKASTGNWTGAGLSALGSYAQMGSLGSTAAEGANGGLAATEATSGLSSTGGEAAGTVSSGSEIANSADAANAASNAANTSQYGMSYGGEVNSFGQAPASSVNEFGYQGLSSPSSSAANTQFMATPTSQFSSAAGVGGVGPGFEGTSASVGAGTYGKGFDWTKAGLKGAELYMKQAQSAEQQAKQRALLQQARAQGAMNSIAMEPTPARPVMSLQSTSPYAQFNGGFNPRRYGSNVRNRGLLG